MPDHYRINAIWTWVCVALYLALCVAAIAVWEPSHDEGVTWDQALGDVVIPNGSEGSVAISELYGAIAGPSIGIMEVAGRLTSNHGMHPPAYYWLLNVWTRVGGTSRFWICLPALLVGCFALPAMRRLSSRLNGGSVAGRRAMLLLALAPAFVGFSVYARPYGIAIGLVVLSSDALLRFNEKGLAPKLLFIAISTLGIYTLYHYVFVLVWQLSWLALDAFAEKGPNGRKRLLEVGGCVALISLAYMPWLPSLLSHLQATTDAYYFTGSVPFAQWPSGLVKLSDSLALGEARVIPLSSSLSIGFGLLALATAFGAGVSFIPGMGSRYVRVADASARHGWATMVLVPISIAVADAWHGTHTLFISKTSFALIPILVILIARASCVPKRSVLQRMAMGLWLTVFVFANLGNVFARHTQDTVYEALTRNIVMHDAPEHLIVLSSNLRGYTIPLLLSLRRAGVEHVQVVHATSKEIMNFEALSRNEDTRHLTLVNLSVHYYPEHIWQPEQLLEVGKRAQQLGWKVREGGGGNVEGPLISIWRVVPVKYYGGG